MSRRFTPAPRARQKVIRSAQSNLRPGYARPVGALRRVSRAIEWGHHGASRREFPDDGGRRARADETGARVPQAEVLHAAGDRALWVAKMMRRLADPVLRNLAAGTLKARMPVEQAAGADRRNVTHLEALKWLLAGACTVDRDTA